MCRLSVVLVVAIASAAPAFGDEPGPPEPQQKAAGPSERRCADGKLVDPYWSFTFTLPGLAEGMAPGGAKLFEGKAGELTIEILVQEGDRARTAAQWRDEAMKAWTGKKREMKDAASGSEPCPWETFVEKSLSGMERHHGYAFRVRGLQAFVVHACASAKTETSGAAIAQALGALVLGEDRGASVVAQTMSKRMGKPADSTTVLCVAGQTYAQPRDQGGVGNAAMAEVVLTRALAGMKEKEPAADDVYGVHELLGLATLTQRRTDAAIGWFGKAVELAAKTSKPAENAALAGYNLACAYSVAGKLDLAFAALERSCAQAAPVDVAQLRTDADLENLRKDPRWEAFLAKRSKAAAGPR